MPDWKDIVAIGKAAERVPQTVLDYFRGRPSRGTTVRAIERALVELGLEHLRRAA